MLSANQSPLNLPQVALSPNWDQQDHLHVHQRLNNPYNHSSTIVSSTQVTADTFFSSNHSRDTTPSLAAHSFQRRINHSLVSRLPSLNIPTTNHSSYFPRRIIHTSARPRLIRHAAPRTPIDDYVDINDTLLSNQSCDIYPVITAIDNYSSITNISLESPSPTPSNRVRSLILPMSAAVASRLRDNSGRDSPGSPPDLTDSKSSKSSSFHSCGLADANPGDLSNFEDISLEEIASVHSANQRTQNSNSAQFYRFSPHHTKAPRDLMHNAATRSLTNLSNGIFSGTVGRSNRYQLPVPGPRTSRSKPRISPQPFLHTDAQSSSRSRSISPASGTHMFTPTSMPLPQSHSSGGSTFSQSQFNSRRKQLAYTRRKSVLELEKEFDELDDELPDDAIIYNVPISPRPPHERSSSTILSNISENMIQPNSTVSRPQSRQDSGDSSPERSFKRTNTDISLNSISQKLSISPLSPALSDVSSEFSGSHTATKSRATVLYDLNKDARELTEALEVFAEETEKKHEHAIQAGKVPLSKAEPISVPSTISRTLPPLRKNDPLIDPLPASKEKERYLTRTRPSWLPPKNQKEEQKHLKEYQKMMARAAEAEKKRARQAHKLQCERDAATAETSKYWDSHIIPNWDSAIQEPRTKELWWRGIPTQRRGEVWSKAVGNDLGLMPSSFDTALFRARELQTSLQGRSEEERLRDPMGYVFAGLKEDAITVYPDLNLFQVGGPLHESLLDVCMAFAVYRANIDWDYGIMTLAALLLVNLQPAESFITLANIFNRSLPSAILTHEPTTLSSTYNMILATIAYKRPQLHAHLITLRNLSEEGFPIWENASVTSPISPSPATPTFVMSPIESTLPPRPRSPSPSPGPLLDPSVYLFPVLHGVCSASSRLSIEAVSRIWDVIVFEGDIALVRAAVAVITRLESGLYGSPLEMLDELDGPKWHVGEIDTLMRCMRDMGHMDEEH